MKRTILTFLSIAGSIVLFAQDPMSTSRAADLSGRTAARDMNKIVTPPALPVLNTFVEPEVMTRTTGSYGQKLYSITQVKDAMGETAYQVTLLENGQTKSEWITESGTAVVNMFRTPETDSLVALRDRNRADSMNNAMNANNSMNTMNNTNAGNNTMNNTNTTTTTTNSTTTTTTDSTNMQNNTNMTTDTTNRMNNSTNMNNTQLNSNTNTMNNAGGTDSSNRNMNNNNGMNTGNITDSTRSGMDKKGTGTNKTKDSKAKDTKGTTTKPKE